MHDVDDHLPECPALGLLEDDMTGAYFYVDDEEGIFYVTCVCSRLRACEQRVRDEERALVAVEQTTLAELNAEYRKGLDAAHEAVAAVGIRKDTSYDMRVQALAAIDALKEER